MPEHNAKQSILIVEESATLRYILGKTLSKQGYELISVDSFASATETLQKNILQLHAIVVGWPNYEHFDESKQLLVLLDREPYSEIPVVLLSNDAEVELLSWMSTRKTTALVPWENYQEAVSSLQSMLDPDSQEPVIEQRQVHRDTKPTSVLFVDDSKSIRVYYKRLLERNGYTVVTANSVDEAYKTAQGQAIDIAIVDYFMPEQNGYVLCQKLRDNPLTTGIRTAVITGTYLDSVIRDCLQAGAIECMFKNEAEELFLARIAGMRRFIEVQRSIEKQRENLAAILESVGEGVYGVDRDGCITFMNPAALKVLGLHDVKPLLGVNAVDAFHSKDQGGSRDLLKEAYLSGEQLKGWETQFRHQSGKEIPIDCTLYTLSVDDKKKGSVIAFRDISERKMMEEKLRWQATHDHLTGLYNRRYLEGVLEKEIDSVNRTSIMSALIYIDLDRFKYVNDTAGHDVGDKLLVDLSQEIDKNLRRHDISARIGGDEFAVILKNVDENVAINIADEIRVSLSKLRVHHEDKAYHVNASFGVAMIDILGATAGDVLANADIACHISKRLGRNQTHLYEKDNDDRNTMGSELGWSMRIRDALEKNKFCLHYQPIMKMADIDLVNLPAQDGALWKRHLNESDKTHSYEVLVRMIDENNELHYPDSFIPTAERFNMMTDIDMWVLENSLQAVSAASVTNKNIRLSINISGGTVDSDESLEKIKVLIEQYNIVPSTLTFEVTETCAIANLEQANDFISELRKIGCRFSLDDFGSGFCSFSQLKNLPTDFVKIDGQFVRSMARGATDRAIVTAMNDVAHSLGRYTVAEYVESPEIVRLLKICGVDKIQGNYISVPLTELPDNGASDIQKEKVQIY
ncbi:diguanylate cyclase/phosphodiesterase (GGDEF & EAL domains) with PAS/PAC sensor(s) [hydrothermal vent metagenome]|uniref:Diguanylate cyclase/phosphodiesterase (GGDEF & EAL domains) with PAS/PAC sensor(S) n=1 Tax=hydrothermal vent metagenome TaxID=652676 RepID=A0A3B0W4W4_9ZZZZ